MSFPFTRQYDRSSPYGVYESAAVSRQNDMPELDGSGRVDFTAPVIHFNSNRETAPRRSTKDHFVKGQDDKQPAALMPISKEAKLLTLFLGHIPLDFTDYWMERMLKPSAKLAQWRRAVDGTGRARDFGFATYEDPENLIRALKILTEVRLPTGRNSKEYIQFTITQDASSQAYIEDYQELKKPRANDAKERNHQLSATGQVEKVLKDFANPKFKAPSDASGSMVESIATRAPETLPVKAEQPADPNAVTIMLQIEDELGDIPEEQRASIAQEITSFRERSAKRDKERARQIAELEAGRLDLERANRGDANRNADSRKTADEAISLIRGPRRRIPDFIDEQMSEAEVAASWKAHDQVRAKKEYEKELERWSHQEALRIAAYKQELAKELDESKQAEVDKAYQLEKFERFDDEKEAHRMSEPYYSDYSAWARSRSAFRSREMEQDKEASSRDRELLERAASASSKTLESAASPIEGDSSRAETAPLRIALGKVPDDTKRRAAPSTTLLLAEEEEAESKQRRALIDIDYTNGLPKQNSTAQIHTSKEELWSYEVNWTQWKDGMLPEIRAFVGECIVEILGMEEADLISAIISIIESRGSGRDIEEELKAAIGDEAESEATAVKIWRFLLELLDR